MTIAAKIHSAAVEFVEQRLPTPLVLSTGPITALTEARVAVEVEAEGRTATGRGSIYLSDLWAWPDSRWTHAARDAELQRLCRDIASRLDELCGRQAAHPLRLGMQLHDEVCGSAVDSPAPALARAMCLSPFDAALHDATGIALGRSAFDLYGEPLSLPAVDKRFRCGSAAAAIRRCLRPVVGRLPAWLIVGKDDSLERDVRPWVAERGYGCFKLKIMGKDNRADAARTADVYRAVRSFGVASPVLSVDSNEGNPDADSVEDYLHRLQETDPEAFRALLHVEQPTGRDLRAHRHDWRRVAALKPVLLDEGLTSLDVMSEAMDQGWSGFALKTCKGHSFALIAAAWARERGLLLSLQDLTNPGYSLIHAALFAGHIETLNGVELNSPQFTPAANQEWLPRLGPLFEPTDGFHRLPATAPAGLGSGW